MAREGHRARLFRAMGLGVVAGALVFRCRLAWYQSASLFTIAATGLIRSLRHRETTAGSLCWRGGTAHHRGRPWGHEFRV